MNITMKFNILSLLLLFLLASRVAATPSIEKGEGGAAPAPMSKPVSSNDGSENGDKLIWFDDFDTALAKASMEYRPILIEFFSPQCPWCRKLDMHVFSSPDVKALLKEFVLVRIDVTQDRKTAAMFQISSIPVISFCSADAVEMLRLNGYVDKAAVLKAMSAVLNKKIVAKKSSQLHIMLEQLKKHSVEKDAWPEIMMALGKYPNVRKEIIEMIRGISPFPKKIFVDMLKDKRIAVRLGAIEILEEQTGNDFDYDPWEKVESTKNQKALKEWEKWAEIKGGSQGKLFSTLTRRRCDILILQSVCGDRRRELRALRLLREGGPAVVSAIEKFLTDNPEISEGKRNKIKELQYSILIPASIGRDPVMLAHKLIFGKLDSRMQAILELKKASPSVIPILEDLLHDKDSMIRETAIDSLITVGGKDALDIVGKHLLTEKDEDVVFAALRGISEIKSKKSGTIFAKYLQHSNEDLVIAALNGIAATKSSISTTQLRQKLQDKRWRVRVAALNAVERLEAKNLAKDVEKMLADKDHFVRYKAVETLSCIDKPHAPKKLEKVFLSDDSLKGAIVAAYGKMNKKIPSSFIEALKGKSEQVLMDVVQGMDECGKGALPLAVYLAGSKRKDIRLPAISFIAKNGVTRTASKNNAILVQKLESGDDQDVLAVLHSFSSPMKKQPIYISSDGGLDNLLLEIEESSDSGDEKQSDGDIVDLFESFEDSPEKEEHNPNSAISGKSTVKENSAKDIMDLFNSFENEKPKAAPKGKVEGDAGVKVSENAEKGGEGADGKARAKPEKGRKNLNDIKSAVNRCFNRSKNEEIKLYAASVLVLLGDKDSIPYLKEHFNSQTVEMRTTILELMEDAPRDDVVEVAFLALDDPEDAIRKNATEIILATKKGKYISRLLRKMEDTDSPLKPYDLDVYRFRNIFDSLPAKKAARKWAVRILKSQESDQLLKSLALFIYDKSYLKGDDKIIEPFARSENKWLRRAAYHALGQNRSSRSRFFALIPELMKDKAKEVRIVLPKIIQKRAEQFTNSWVHFYDAKHFVKDYYWSGNGSVSRKLGPAVEEALRKMLDDEDLAIRMEASFALLKCRKSIDLNKFTAVLETFPDQNAIGRRVKQYLENNYKVLGKSFDILLQFINREDMSDSDVKNIFKHFNVAGNKIKSMRSTLRQSRNEEVRAAFIKPKSGRADKEGMVPPENMRLVYFSKKGCQDCARVKKELKKLKEIFPDLVIETHNISKIDSMRLNEIYCERFGVPAKMRLVAPAVFAGKGFLIKTDITMDKLIPLTAKSATVPLAEWYKVTEKDVRVSESRIKERYSKTSIWLILLAGFLDGINPCAFATIIFFLSYLQITRKKPREIMMVGGSFIVAVFISYMAFGLGLNEIIGRLYIFDVFRLWFNRIMMLAVFVIMVMSLYDGIMCARGKMESMALQLPGFLKERIRKTIRTSSKNSKYVIAAFITGCIISFLELACTGQVYLPTIAYMWQTGSDYSGAIFYLLVYNLMFIFPLIVIFLAAYYGMKSDRLTTLFKKHAALVKFSTALLFLVLLIFLLSSSMVL